MGNIFRFSVRSYESNRQSEKDHFMPLKALTKIWCDLRKRDYQSSASISLVYCMLMIRLIRINSVFGRLRAILHWIGGCWSCWFESGSDCHCSALWRTTVAFCFGSAVRAASSFDWSSFATAALSQVAAVCSSCPWCGCQHPVSGGLQLLKP